MPRHCVENRSVNVSMNLRRSGSWKSNADCCVPKPRTRYSALRPPLLQPQLRNARLCDKSSLLQKPHATLLHRLRLNTGAQSRLPVPHRRQQSRSDENLQQQWRKLRGGHQGPQELPELSPPKIASRHVARARESLAEEPRSERMMYRVSLRLV